MVSSNWHPYRKEAEREAEAIAHLLNAEAITGDRATKAAIVQQLPQAQLVYLATHGLLSEIQEFGIPGAIALAPSPGDDGFLTAGEIFNLRLNAELVVLSACDTGRGTITGDGPAPHLPNTSHSPSNKAVPCEWLRRW